MQKKEEFSTYIIIPDNIDNLARIGITGVLRQPADYNLMGPQIDRSAGREIYL